LEEAAAQLALAESYVHNAPPARRRRLTVAIASLRLALARRNGRFSEVLEQVNLLGASIADESNDQIAMGSELRAVALLNLGIVETWSRRFDDAERHLSEGAALAKAMGRPYLEVACRAHQIFPTTLVSRANARERGREAVALAERHGLEERPILAPALGAVAFWAIWMGEFDEGESALRRAWEVAEPQIDPAPAVLLQLATGMLRAGHGQHQAALEAFAAGAQAQSLLTGVHALATPVVGWLAATQARLGMPDEARATLTGFSAEHERMGLFTTRVQSSAWRRETPIRRWIYSKTCGSRHPRSAYPRSRSLNPICLPAPRICPWGIAALLLPQPRQRSRWPSRTG
jgi:LuxR family maltose regulon positive regulatory protein